MRHGTLHRRLVAADDHLAGAVVIGDGANLALRRRLGDAARRLEIEPQQRCHRAGAHRDRALHREAPALQQPRRLGERERAGGGQRRILAKRMAGDESHMTGHVEPALALEHPHHREAHRHQRRLRVLGQRQLFLRPLEHQPRQLLTQRLVDLLEDLARRREGAGEVASHADGLRALSGEDQRARHRRAALRRDRRTGNCSPCTAPPHRRSACSPRRPASRPSPCHSRGCRFD